MKSRNGGRYEQIIDGEWTRWDRIGNKDRCCDCGLVHIVDYRIVAGPRKIIQARYKTDRKATARIRKRNGITVITKKPRATD